MNWLARNAGALSAVQAAKVRRAVAPPRRERNLQRELAVVPRSADAVLRIEYEAVADGLKQGARHGAGGLPGQALVDVPLSEVKTQGAPVARALTVTR